MLHSRLNPQQKRRSLREGLSRGGLLRFPGAFSPLVALMIERIGFEGVYLSGAVISADLGLPDIGLTTLGEVSGRSHAIARTTNLPAIVDIDTGFGEPLNAARAVQVLEDLGLCGCHLEDQRNPKRCGHLDHKQLVPAEEMERKIRAAVSSRRDPDFLLIARTDARASEGIGGVVERCKRYVDAGADALFPEALADRSEFERVRSSFDVPLIANMTEFGKSELMTAGTLRELGYNIVLYPVTSLRLAMFAVEAGLRRVAEEGTQADLLAEMQTRSDLYELLDYGSYSEFDRDIFNFDPPG
ncbi:methylisocitrate lyase [Tautonia plasticadhaerens]|uniref:Methylisocitrate lyase n=1 Tax=Tautonia plasticadhaerens TaxID=2527974 RepID=A0A518H9D9_9BACT|nr:methylisocitrate lyase [Tautonia plasticadhaerens]QDV37469.1 Carboxyvinyl-carboxyphosphonate phosphorylmutase [Tautonia plasticadhaerens]